MKASDFEYRHRTLLHLTAVSIAFLTYLIDRDDIVWAMVRGYSRARLLERAIFAVATALIGIGSILRTWGRASTFAGSLGKKSVWLRSGCSPAFLPYPFHVGTLLFSIGLGFLAPLSGFVFLIVAEAIFAFRLILRENAADGERLRQALFATCNGSSGIWRDAFRLESGKWGLFFTMVVFTLLLNDRFAEVMGAGSFVFWIARNYKSCHSAMGLD